MEEIRPIEEIKKTPAKSLKYLRDKDRQKVRGIFRFYEVPGGVMSFVAKAYKGDDVERYDLLDGHVYEVPLGVAKHLNKNGWYPIYEYIPGDKEVQAGIPVSREGGATQRIVRKVHRFGFQSLEFVDEEDLDLGAPNKEGISFVESV